MIKNVEKIEKIMKERKNGWEKERIDDEKKEGKTDKEEIKINKNTLERKRMARKNGWEKKMFK